MNVHDVLRGLSVRLTDRRLWLAPSGALLFWAMLHWSYLGIDPQIYQYRDDGIITLSHARNWVDFGFIGVNPSGERIEGTSAPLQFLLYAVAYAVTGLGYEAFMDAQTTFCTLVLGGLVTLLFANRPLFAFGACIVAAFALGQMSAFLVWHGSGMENALTHALLLWTVLLLHRYAVSGRIARVWALVPFAASITRIDGIYYLAPLLIVFCIYWHWHYRDRQARSFTMLFLALWLAFMALRFAYFGALAPNTATAQGISIGQRLMELVELSPLYLDQSFNLARGNFSRHGGYLLLLALPLVAFRPRHHASVLLLSMMACVIVSAFFAPFVFGPARLDVGRTTTQMALFCVLTVVTAASSWQPRRVDAYALPIVVLFVFLLHEYNYAPPREACCSPRDFDATRLRFEQIGREHGIHRPTVSNPDLGVLSWHKQLNVVDLGMLGSSVLSRLEPGAAVNRYLFEYVSPDIIESHGWWTCRYVSFFTDPRFRASYVEADAPGRQVMGCKGVANVPTGIWIRRDVMRESTSRERAFMDALAREPAAGRVEAELRACERADARPTGCTYVARSVYRMLPEFRARGEQHRLETVFATSRTRTYDMHLVAGAQDPTMYRKVVDALNTTAQLP